MGSRSSTASTTWIAGMSALKKNCGVGAQIRRIGEMFPNKRAATPIPV